jgi:hypothetical protein
MDLAKFLSLLEESAIYCAQIRTFIDRHEGFIHDNFYEDLNVGMHPFVGGEEVAVLTTRNAVATLMDACFVSCWHLAEGEEPLMWTEYVGKCHGVALRSDTERLSKAVSGSAYDVRSGSVTYMDVESETVTREVPIDSREYADWAFGGRSYQLPALIDLLKDSHPHPVLRRPSPHRARSPSCRGLRGFRDRSRRTRSRPRP